ncbi:phosphoribosylglycinamide formyltransferase [Terrimonas sp.]|uniref:phosphoribosylglycinamide formyltransferase n=1 Tax=Terrimonas sp. TaxID=1914338 RepID=UPI001F0C2BDA|nr:phosphoribosylglycinamide formyltransferase [Terrimonas sp.]
MLKKLQQKWKVSGRQLFIILCVFAITGTTTAWLTRVITGWAGFTAETFWLWRLLLRLTMLVIGYQVILLSVAFIFGQFPFFWQYEKKMLRWMRGKRSAGSGQLSAVSYQPSAVSGDQQLTAADEASAISSLPADRQDPQSQISNLKSQIPNNSPMSSPTRLAVFASGTGSNAQKIIDFFRNDPSVEITLIVSNKPAAGVLQIAGREKIASLIIEKGKFFNGDAYVDELKQNNIDWIILAGFLWKVPAALIQAFPVRIINIHPALLPQYGGKGMYGHFVHEAVIASGDKQSGITIHYVDELFDHGAHIFQAHCDIEPGETPETLAKKVQVLEHKYFPEVIKKLITENEPA